MERPESSEKNKSKVGSKGSNIICRTSTLNYTWTFEDTTLSQAISRIRRSRSWRGDAYSFKVRNDRKLEYLVFKKVFDRVDLLRAIKSETHCKIHEAGQSVLIILPKLE